MGQGTRGFILVRPLTVKVKAYIQFEVVLIRVSITRELNRYAWLDQIVLCLKPLPGRPLIYTGDSRRLTESQYRLIDVSGLVSTYS